LAFLHLLSAGILIAVTAFVLGFELTWTVLGVFIDPTWSIPLLTMYAMFIVHAILWAQRIYYVAVTFRDQIISSIAKEVLKNILKTKFGTKIEDILKFLETNRDLLEKIGFQLDDVLKKEISNLTNNSIPIVNSDSNNKPSNSSLVAKPTLKKSIEEIKVDVLVDSIKIDPVLLTNENLMSALGSSSLTALVKALINDIKKLSSLIMKKLSLTPTELIILAIGTTINFIILAVFVYWAFQQFTRETIGFAFLQVLFWAIVAAASKVILAYKNAEKQFKDPQEFLEKNTRFGKNTFGF